jgi:hypothetical protein
VPSVLILLCDVVYIDRGLDLPFLPLNLTSTTTTTSISSCQNSYNPANPHFFPPQTLLSHTLLHPSLHPSRSATVPPQAQSLPYPTHSIWLDSFLSSRLPTRYSDPSTPQSFLAFGGNTPGGTGVFCPRARQRSPVLLATPCKVGSNLTSHHSPLADLDSCSPLPWRASNKQEFISSFVLETVNVGGFRLIIRSGSVGSSCKHIIHSHEMPNLCFGI